MSDFDLSSLGEDFTQYERTVGEGGATTLPIGFYTGIITRANMNETKDGTGKYLEIEFDITSPSQFSNRKFWDKFNIINKNPTAVKIAKEQLADLLKALGFAHPPNTSEMEGREVAMYLGLYPARTDQKTGKTYSESNKCLKYLPADATEEDYHAWYASKKGNANKGVVPERKAFGAAAPAAQPAATGAPKASWKKKI